MEKDEIYITVSNEKENLRLIIDGDDHSVWAYVIDAKNQISFDGFLCSRGTVVDTFDRVNELASNDFHPPLMKDFANEYSVHSEIQNDDIRIDWDKHLIQVSINDEVYLKMDVRKKESYSKALSKNGAYGNSLNVG